MTRTTKGETRREVAEPQREACAQCEANARWNEAGGYKELAEECRAYCRRGHIRKDQG